MLLVSAVSALSVGAYAHGGGKGTGGSSGGGSASSGSSSGSGHSASSTSGGHSATSTTSGHSATASKGTHSTDPAQSGVNGRTFQEGRFRVFVQPGRGSGYNSQNTVSTTEDRRKHQRLFLGFIRY
ncbi:MAG: hypothetical protein JO275_15265 [Verrucomicrobia bacterium]|nr:hypothetical protein [Verrucomicrobiota bacterium]